MHGIHTLDAQKDREIVGVRNSIVKFHRVCAASFPFANVPVTC